MQKTGVVDSFLKFVFVFLLFIGISFGVSFGALYLDNQHKLAAQEAAAMQTLLSRAP